MGMTEYSDQVDARNEVEGLILTENECNMEQVDRMKAEKKEVLGRIEELIDGLRKDGGQNAEIITVFQEQFSQINETFDSIMENIEGLHAKSKRIKDIVDVISNIARQTNLLAINATIEAARAGVNGKAFGVVADEVKRLSTQTSSSSVTIREIVEEISKEINSAKSNVDEIAESFGNLTFDNISVDRDFKSYNVNVQKTVETMLDFIKSKFDAHRMAQNPKYFFDGFQHGIEKIVEDLTKGSKQITSLYFWIDPALLKHLDPNEPSCGITSVVIEGTVRLDRDQRIKDFKPGNEQMAWFYDTARARRGLWNSLSYDVHLRKEVLTYTMPLIIEERLIGVGGADIDFEQYCKMKQDETFQEITRSVFNLAGE